MRFAERNEGAYRVYAGAMEAIGGYSAAVVISRVKGVPNGPREAYKDLAMSGGHRWETAEQALRYAVARGCEIVRSEPSRLMC